MGLVDKLKNIFTEEVTEEEEEEIKVEQIKKEVRSVPIESPSVERREKKVTRTEKRRVPVEDDLLGEEEQVIEEEKTKSPVFFTDRDFEDLVAPKKSREKVKAEKAVEPPKKEESPKPYGGTYNSTTIIHKEKQNFKPTPIISPVYGVLDKNYHKEDIIDKNEEISKDSADGLSVDTIRNKAYGTLEDDLEDTMVKPTPKKVEKEIEEDVDLFDELEQSASLKEEKTTKAGKDVRKLEEITMDLTKELDNLLLKKEKEKEERVKEQVSNEKEEKEEESLPESDLFNLIDSMYDEGEDE